MFNWSFNWSKRTHRGLRHWILYLLQDSPKNGAEIMDSMEAMSRGWWRPSPGSVYPILESMVKDGVIKKSDSGRYELTETGKQEIDWPRQFRSTEPRSVDDVVEQMSAYVSYLEDVSTSKDGKVSENGEKIKELSRRLAKVAESQ